MNNLYHKNHETVIKLSVFVECYNASNGFKNVNPKTLSLNCHFTLIVALNATNCFNKIYNVKITKLMLKCRFTLFVALNSTNGLHKIYTVKITELSLNCCFGFNKLAKKQFTLCSA